MVKELSLALVDKVKTYMLKQNPIPSTPQAVGETVPISISREPIGSPGTQSFSGYNTEEYLGALRGHQRADVFDQMRRSDPQIVMCLSAVKGPIQSANWEVEPADDSQEAWDDKELIEQILFKDMDLEWIDFLGEALTCVDFGHAVFEPIHKIVTDNKKFKTYNSLKTLAFRSPKTIHRWNLDKNTGDLLSVSQYAYGDLQKTVDIPAHNLIIYSLRKEGANYEGISMLRSCFGSWFRKNNYMKLNAIGIEKFAVPTPLVKVPSGKHTGPEYNHMVNSLEYYLCHEQNYLTYPEGWEIDLKSNTYDPMKVEGSIDSEDKRIVKAFLANFLELGMNGTGAYALSNDLSDFFLSGLEHIAGKICSPINRKLIPNLIQMNRGQRDAYPTLKASGISDKAGKELAEVCHLLQTSRVLTPDDLLEDHIRKRFGLPKVSLEGRRQAEPAPAQAPTLVERIKAAEARNKKRRIKGKLKV